jgi:PilZ domain
METVLSWRSGAVECRVVAAAGQFVLLRPERREALGTVPSGECSLTYLDGMVPMGWDGSVEAGGHPGELRFRVGGGELQADRRSSARVPVFASVEVEVPGQDTFEGQLLDVSAGGMRFRALSRIGIGTPVHVRSTLHEGLVVDADAVVRASEPSVASVEFTAMHGADAQAIGAWTVGVLRASLAGRG